MIRVRNIPIAASFAIAGALFFNAGFAQETCGLQNAKFSPDVFQDRFEAFGSGSSQDITTEQGALFQPSTPLGPPISTVPPPTLGVTPSVSITYPGLGAVLSAGKVQVAGTFSGPVGTGVAVNGIVAYVQGGEFAIPQFVVETGSLSLQATATTIDELTASDSRSVTVTNTAQSIGLNVSQPVGFAPFPAAFFLQIPSSITVQSISVQFGDGGSFNGSDPNVEPRHRYEQPGIYQVDLIVQDTDQNQYNTSRRIVVLDLIEQRETVCSVYAHLKSRLTADDANGAAQAFHVYRRQRYQNLFDALGANRPIAATRLGQIANGTFSINDASLILVNLDPGDVINGYPIRFALDGSGVWRIISM